MNDNNNFIKDSLSIHLNTENNSGILLNGQNKSSIYYNLKNYLNFENDDSIEYVSLELPYFQTVNSNYNVNEYNNKVYYCYEGTNYENEIQVGNYTINTFLDELRAIIFPLAKFIITYDKTINKIQIYYTGSNLIDQWGFLTGTNSIYSLVGLNQNQNLLTTGNNYLNLPNCYNFLPTPRFILHCSILNNGFLLKNNSQIGACDILASIPNNTNLNSMITFQGLGTEFILKNLSNISDITINITDDQNNLINFNGISTYFVLKFNIYRKYLRKTLNFSKILLEANKNIINEE